VKAEVSGLEPVAEKNVTGAMEAADFTEADLPIKRLHLLSTARLSIIYFLIDISSH
jgi:hypothetical protein